MVMVIFLIIVIAVGVLLISDVGRGILAVCLTLASFLTVIGVIGVIGFYVILAAIALFGL